MGTIGITAFAQEQLREVLYIELPERGSYLRFGQPFALVESAKVSVELDAPVSGEVTNRNGALFDSPGTINESPYGDGWMVRVLLEGAREQAGLLDAETYRQLCQGASRQA